MAHHDEFDTFRRNCEAGAPQSTQIGGGTRQSEGPPFLRPEIVLGQEVPPRAMDDETEANAFATDEAVGGEPSIASIMFTMTQLMQQNATMMQQIQQTGKQRQFHVMPDLSKTIGDFDGERGPDVAKSWLEEVFRTAALHSWPESFTYETINCHLVGAARSWFLGRRSQFRNMEQFKVAFNKTFVRQSSKSDAWELMKKRKQEKDENISAYFHDKVRLCRPLGLSFNEIKEQVAAGLLSREVALHVCAASHADEDDLFADLGTFGRMLTAFDDLHDGDRKTSIKTFIGNKDKKHAQVSAPVEVGRGATVTVDKNKVKCFRCSKLGHFARRCPETQKTLVCYNCQQPGHTSKTCEKPSSLRRGVVQAISSGEKCDWQKYVKTITLNGQLVEAMIDTGSSDCTIKATTVITRGFHVNHTPSTLRGFGAKGNEVRSCGVVNARVDVDGVQASEVPFRVVPDDVQPWDAIVGRTFTELSHVAFVKVGDRLLFRDGASLDMAAIEVNLDGGVTRPEVLSAGELPPASINFIGMRLGDFEVPVGVINGDTEAKQLQQGDQLGQRMMAVSRAPELPQEWEPIAESEVNVHESVSMEQREDLVGLLNERRRSISKNMGELGCTELLEMDITLKPNAVPVCSRPYRATRDERETIRGVVDEWKQAGIVTETTSAYASPVLLVKKKNGEPRLVVDYRKLNAQTERIHYPLPNIDEYLEVLTGSKVFAVLDLAHGYLQVPMEPNARPKTAFITPDGTGEFTRAVFGLMNAPFYFSKMMELALGPLRNKILLFYLDDILVMARDWDELMSRLRLVLEALERAGLTLKLSKCKFGMPVVEYLGFVISANGVEPGADKVRAIANFPVPRDLHEVRRFLGLTGFFRRFVPGYAAIAAPLTMLTRKATEFSWLEPQKKAFEKLIQILTSKPVLGVFSPAAEITELHTDASSEGLGAILLQANDSGRLHPIYAISRRTSEVESRYHSSRLELMAIVWAVERLRVFLISVKFVVVTDCQALVFLNASRTKNPQVARWCSALSEYDFSVRHRRGEAMQHADALSRAPVEGAGGERLGQAGMYHLENSEEGILLHQRSDEVLKRKINILEKPDRARTNVEKKQIDGYTLIDGLLYKMVDRAGKMVNLYVVPSTMRKALAIKYHDLSSHFGVEKALTRMRQYYHFANMRGYMARHISKCISCLVSKKPSGRQKGELYPIPPGERPFAVVHADHLGPFIPTKKDNKYVFIIIDTLTKYVMLESVRNTSASITVKKFALFIDRFGAPNRIISDRGSNFTSDLFRKFCEEYGVRHTLNSSRHPQANGLVERVNRTILPAMISSVESDDRLEWDYYVKQIEKDVNSTVNKSTGKSPYEVLYGYLPRFNDGNTRLLTEGCETYQPSIEVQGDARRSIEAEQARYKLRYDKNRQTGIQYNVGDIVYWKVNPVSTGESTKLQRRFKGPFVIVEVLPSDTYVIDSLLQRRKQKRRQTAHVTQLKIWRGGDVSSDDEISDAESGKSETEKECGTDSEEGLVRQTSGRLPENPLVEDRNVEKADAPKRVRDRKLPARLRDYVL